MRSLSLSFAILEPILLLNSSILDQFLHLQCSRRRSTVSTMRKRAPSTVTWWPPFWGWWGRPTTPRRSRNSSTRWMQTVGPERIPSLKLSGVLIPGIKLCGTVWLQAPTTNATYGGHCKPVRLLRWRGSSGDLLFAVIWYSIYSSVYYGDTYARIYSSRIRTGTLIS